MLSYCVHVARCSRFRSEVNRLARLDSLATAALTLAIFVPVYLSIYVCRQFYLTWRRNGSTSLDEIWQIGHPRLQ